MKTIKILCTLLCTMLLAALPATAQNSDDKNKAIIETNEGSQELNTDEISVIRFDGGKVTVVQPWGDTFFDHTLRSLSFLRPNPGTLRLTATTSIGTDTGNRAQAINGDNKLEATWESGDVVYVYPDASTTENIGTLTPTSYGSSETTLTGDIDATNLSVDENTHKATLYFSTKDRATHDLTSQDGTVESLFYFTATGTITIDGANASIEDLNFSRPIAIVKFTLKDKATSNAISATSLAVVADGTSYTITPTSASNVLYVGIPGISSKTVTLTTVVGDGYYFYKRDNVSFTANNYYAINVKMHDEPLARPLTFEALGSGSIWFDNRTGGRVTYRKNGGEEKIVNFNRIPISAGDKVSFYGNNSSYDESHISVEYTNCYIYGNIMSLISSTDFAMTTTLTERDVFREFLMGENLLLNHPSKKLLLPATTLSVCCYMEMFYGCTGLTSAPELPATTLAGGCYSAMFGACTGLTSSPVLPAETLVEGCYENMFFNCSNLNKVTCLATDISADWCTANWLYNVAATGTFIKPTSMTDWTANSTSGIPNGWTTVLPGEFTINAGGGKVYFSQGNLQYQASTSTWRFATSQYEAIGSGNSNVSASYDGWIDSFGWGSGNQPTQTSEEPNVYSTFVDWGTNAISNGGNTANLWHTLSESEWTYLVSTRPNANSKRGRATIDGMCCFVLLPDDWVLPSGLSFTPDANNWTNVYTTEQWAQMEAAGAVCFPASGSRAGGTNNTNVNNFNGWCCYWSSTSANSTQGYNLWITNDHIGTTDKGNYQMGASVRLVYEKPYFLGAGTESNPYLISSEADWNYLALKVNSGTSYAGKFFRQTANINVTTMVGNSSDSKPFSGTYDGNGKTLNVSLNTKESHSAPFRNIVNATIKNVVTTGSVSSTEYHPSGLVGITDGTCTIQNCRVAANVGGPQYLGGIVGHCYHANISIIGCVYTGTLTPASGQKTGGILGWGGDGGGHTITISNCLFAGTLANTSTKFNPIGDLYEVNNTDNTKNLSNTYYTLGANISDDDNNSFVKGLSYKGKFARSITAGTDVTAVANAREATVYNVSGITSYGTGILYDGLLYAGNGEAISLTLSHADAPSGYTFSQYTVEGGGTLDNPTSNSPTLTMTDANQTINVDWIPQGAMTFNYTGAVQTFTALATGYYTLTCYGAQGGYSSGGLGGKGGLSQLTYPLTKGDILYIYVGGQGGCIDGSVSHTEGGDGGWNGGGKGGTGVKHHSGSGPFNGGGGGGGATHIATSAIGLITGDKDFTSNHTDLLLIAGGGGGGLCWSSTAGGAGGGAEGGKGKHGGSEWNIAWNNGTLSCGKDGMLSSNGSESAEGCGGGGGGYQGGNTWSVSYNADKQSYSGAGGSSWGETTNGKGYTTTTGGATEGGNGKVVITWYGTTYPTE